MAARPKKAVFSGAIGMCAIFADDRLDLHPGCTPSSPGMAHIPGGNLQGLSTQSPRRPQTSIATRDSHRHGTFFVTTP